MSRRGAKLLITAGVLVLLLAVAIVTLPVWFPWIARPIAQKNGLSYAAYEREGYAAFTLKDVVFRSGTIELKAQEVRSLAPLALAWRLGLNRSDRPILEVNNWILRLEPREGAPQSRTAPVSSRQEPALARSWMHYLETLERWLPSAKLSNGALELSNRVVHVPELTWRRGQLDGTAELSEQPAMAVDFQLALKQSPYTLKARVEPFDALLDVSASTNSTGFFLIGSVQRETNCLYFQGQLPFSNWMSASAVLAGTNLVIPADLLNLPNYEPLQASVDGRWADGSFTVTVKGKAVPTLTNLPAVSANLQMDGTTNWMVLRSAWIDAPGLRAEIKGDVALAARPPWLLEPAQLAVQVDLAQLKFLPFTGVVKGDFSVSPVAGALPLAKFFVSGSELALEGFAVETLEAEGTLSWPELRVSQLQAQLWPGAALTAAGSCNLSNQVVHNANMRLAADRAPAWLPKSIDWTSLVITGAVSGPVAEPVHTGGVDARSLRVNRTAPVKGREPQIRLPEVELAWNGRGLDFESIRLTARSRTNQLQLATRLSIQTNAIRATVEQLAFSSNSSPVLSLTQPADLAFLWGPSKTWSAHSSAVTLAGPGGELWWRGTVDWPTFGRIEVTGARLSPSMIREFVQTEDLTIASLAASASWSNSPVTFQASTILEASPGFPFGVEARLAGNSAGIAIQQAAIVSSNNLLAVVTGQLPVVLQPGAKNLVKIDPSGPVQLTAKAQPDPFLWDHVARLTGWRVEQPELLASVSGTWSAPVAIAQFNADRILAPGNEKTVPALGPLNLVVRAEPGRAVVEKLEMQVQGQPVSAYGEVPLKHLPTENLRDFADWSGASARLRIPLTPIGAYEPLAPKIIAPEGQVEADLALEPGFKLSGDFFVSGARTAPIDTLGPVREINLHVRLQENQARLQSGRARIGGVPVTVTGQATVSPTNFAGATFRVSARGTKVAFSRQPQSIIRGDADVLILKTNPAPPIVTGKVVIRDSYFLSDLGALIPGRVVNPRERPPYFSITDRPIANWRLDVQVTSDRGLQVRTPVGSAEISLNFRLTGTPETPIAVGNAQIVSGLVRFPFGSLAIQQGLITSTIQDPAHPQISLHAAARQYGYDIRLQVTGTINDPVLEFSSTPALGSDQILLMLTAGEMPRGTGTLTAQQRAQAFAMFIGRDLLSKLGMGEQAGERLVVRSGEEFSEEGRPTYDVEYRLTDRWSVTGEYDRFGDFNAGFKWRVYSK